VRGVVGHGHNLSSMRSLGPRKRGGSSSSYGRSAFWTAKRPAGASFSLRSHAAQAHRWVRVAGLGAGGLMLAWLTTIGVMAATFYVSSALDPWILILHLLSIVVFPFAAVISLWNLWATCNTRSGSRNAFAWAWSGVLALSCLTLLWIALVFHLIGLGVAF